MGDDARNRPATGSLETAFAHPKPIGASFQALTTRMREALLDCGSSSYRFS
jgi:hypothetical protein